MLAPAVQHLPADVLRHLAAIAETRETESRPARKLEPAALDELVELLSAGRPPSYGWWRQHLQPRAVTADWPPMPPMATRSRWQPWELVLAAVDLATDGVAEDVAHDTLWALAIRHHLGTPDLTDAIVAYHDQGEPCLG